MARLKNRTTERYFEKGKYVKDGLYCWTKIGADFEWKVECPYNERKAERDCHTAVSKDALDYINELEAKLADVVPKSEVEEYKHNWQKIHDSYNADCLEHYNKGQQDAAREIFEDITQISCRISESDGNGNMRILCYQLSSEKLAELKKKYT